MTADTLVASQLSRACSPRFRGCVSDWAVQHVVLPGSARSERFDPSITPWAREPIDRLGDDICRRLTFVKPVQAGGSVVGEIALCYWVSTMHGGDVQYNWQNDDAAAARWDKKIYRILQACKPVMDRWPEGKFSAMKGLVLFPHMNLMVQGVFTQRRVASDSIKFQVNEEVHDEEGWLPGRLQQAYGRLTAYWDGISVVISNAGRKGSELHKAFEEGTQQWWQVKCPGCGLFHTMRTKWDEKRADLGGLRYDSDGCKREDGSYDYNRLAGTVRYQMPCGHIVHDTVSERRQLSLSGRYSEPTNTGANVSNRSYTLDGVAVDYLPWLTLIQDKHSALRALKYGDPEPYRKYLRERECIFADDNERPMVGQIVLSSDRRKNRDGLPERAFRFCAMDKQRGSFEKGELPHWWAVIRDFAENGDSLLVWEGKLLTDEDAAALVKEHDVNPTCVCCDSGDDTTHVYQFCLRHGFHAIKGEDVSTFAHDDGGRRIYSKERPLHLMVNGPPTQEDPLREPQFWLYSKYGIRDRLHWLRGGGAKWEVPADVSEHYQRHMESTQLEQRRNKNGETSNVWVQVLDRDDLFVCECYCAMMAEMFGVIGQAVTEVKE